MLKEASKLLITALLLAGCSGENPAKTAADNLVAEAATALDRGDFQKAEILLDSLSATYPKQIEAGRAALSLRPRVMERKTEQEIVDLQAEVMAAAARADSLRGEFKAVPVSEDVFEAYMIHKDVPANWRERTTAVSRLTPGGEFYMVSSLAGTSVCHDRIKLSAGTKEVTSGTVKAEREDYMTRESLRFPEAASEAVGAFAAEIDGSPATVTFIGKKRQTAKLTPKEVHAIAQTYRLSRVLHTIADGNRRLQQLKAKLQLARDQAARTNEQDI